MYCLVFTPVRVPILRWDTRILCNLDLCKYTTIMQFYKIALNHIDKI